MLAQFAPNLAAGLDLPAVVKIEPESQRKLFDYSNGSEKVSIDQVVYWPDINNQRYRLLRE